MSKKIMQQFRKTIWQVSLLVTALFLSSCSDVPSDKEIKKLAEQYVLEVGGDKFVRGGVYTANDILGGYVKDSTKIDTIKIVKQGKGETSFPVRIRVKGSYEYGKSGLINGAFRVKKEFRTFDEEREFYIKKDDYGEWFIQKKNLW